MKKLEKKLLITYLALMIAICTLTAILAHLNVKSQIAYIELLKKKIAQNNTY